jgi:hypothetical protein
MWLQMPNAEGCVGSASGRRNGLCDQDPSLPNQSSIVEAVGDTEHDVKSDVAAVEAQSEVCGSRVVQPYGAVM